MKRGRVERDEGDSREWDGRKTETMAEFRDERRSSFLEQDERGWLEREQRTGVLGPYGDRTRGRIGMGRWGVDGGV